MAVILTAENLQAARRASGRPGSNESDLGTGDKPGAGASPAKPDDALAKILKMIPGEAAVAYTGALAIGTEASDSTAKFMAPLVFVLCAVMVPFLINRDGARHTPPVEPEPAQHVFQLLAFVAWAFSIGNPIAGFGLTVPKWIPAVFAIFLPIFGGLIMGRKAPAP